VRFAEAAVTRWGRRRKREALHALLLGVTPELVRMAWPKPTRLLAVDRSPTMLRHVWPGNVPGTRQAIRGNWLDLPVAPRSQDVVIGDGCFPQLDYPTGQRAFAATLHRALHPGGILVMRSFVRLPRRESVGQVFDALLAGRIGSFHVLKLRLAMALHQDSRQGVRLHDVWMAWQAAGIDASRLPAHAGWSADAVGTIDFYRGQNARLTLSTLAEHQALLSEWFDEVSIEMPDYELGERCPMVVCRPKVRITQSNRRCGEASRVTKSRDAAAGGRCLESGCVPKGDC
jgi:SAM-dependent methyltransferase